MTNAAWLVMGRSVNMFLTLIVGILVARYLGPAEFGLMSYIISFVTLFAFFANLGIDGMLGPELVKHSEEHARHLGSAFVIKLCGAGLALFLITLTVYLANLDTRVGILIIVYGSSAVFQSFNVLQAFFDSQVQAKRAMQAELSQVAIGGIIKIGLIGIGAPLESFILVAVLEWGVLAGALVFLYRRGGHTLSSWRVDRQTCWAILKKSLPLVLSGMTIIIYQRIDQIMLKHMCGPTAVGHYAVAGRLCALVAFVPAG